MPVFPTTIAGSLPKPVWLAEPNKLWAPWRVAGAELDEAKRDATLLALKLQEDAGIDILTEGEQAVEGDVHHLVIAQLVGEIEAQHSPHLLAAIV